MLMINLKASIMLFLISLYSLWDLSYSNKNVTNCLFKKKANLLVEKSQIKRSNSSPNGHRRKPARVNQSKRCFETYQLLMLSSAATFCWWNDDYVYTHVCENFNISCQFELEPIFKISITFCRELFFQNYFFYFKIIKLFF